MALAAPHGAVGRFIVHRRTLAPSKMSAPVPTSARRGGGGNEPDPKRRRILDAGGPIEDEETARQKMRDAKVYALTTTEEIPGFVGFDPDSVSVKRLLYAPSNVSGSQATPMSYFSRKGDLPMMRWLYMKGADTRDEDEGFWFPMCAAANRGYLECCKWLYEHGASSDVKRETRSKLQSSCGLRPLTIALRMELLRPLTVPASMEHMQTRDKYADLCKWLILKGALCQNDDSGNLAIEKVQFDFIRNVNSMKNGKVLLEWARKLQQTRVVFQAFLNGTLARREYSRDVGPLKVFSGKSGILELIGNWRNAWSRSAHHPTTHRSTAGRCKPWR